jgi:cardiolipin synthase
MGAVAGVKRWPDLSLLLKGPAALQLSAIFRADWAFASGESLSDALTPPSCESGREVTTLRVVASGPDIEADTLRNLMASTLCKVQSRVWIVSPYYVPDELLHEMLCLAARRGVDVRLIMPARSNHRLADLARQGYLLELQQAGGKVILYEMGMLHAKIMLVDEMSSITGSANMDVRSLLLNYEVAVACESQALSKAIEDWINGLMEDCVISTGQRNSMWRELGYGIGRLLAPLL